MRDHHHNSANEKPLHFELPVSSNGLFLYNSPTSPFSYKRMFLSTVSPDLPIVFATASLPELQFSAIPEWTHFADKITGYFSFKVNTSLLLASFPAKECGFGLNQLDGAGMYFAYPGSQDMCSCFKRVWNWGSAVWLGRCVKNSVGISHYAWKLLWNSRESLKSA